MMAVALMVGNEHQSDRNGRILPMPDRALPGKTRTSALLNRKADLALFSSRYQRSISLDNKNKLIG